MVAARTEGAVEHGSEGVPTLTPPFPRIEWVPSLNAALGADAMAMDDERCGTRRGASVYTRWRR